MKTEFSGCSGKTKNDFNVIKTREKQKADKPPVSLPFKTFLVFILFLFSLTMTACGSKDSNSTPPEIQPKSSVTMKVLQKGSTIECPNGGISIKTGIDDNGNGVLDPGEEDDTQVLCNGVDGGLTTLISITDEAPGDNCTYGGKKIETGADNNGDGELGSDEVDEINYVCNGEDGVDGQNGQNGQDGQDGADGQDGQDGQNGLTTLISITDEVPGDNCLNGGIKVDAGLDDNGSGSLDPEEIDDTKYVCDGNDAPATLISVTDAGESCTNGGKKVEIGIDDNNSGSLDLEEVDDAWYVCNGVDGQNGQDGLTSLISITDEGPGGNCTYGGKKINVGLDDSDINGILDPDEVGATHYVCNGSGGGGVDGLTSLTSINKEPAGLNCADGGIKIEVGLDDNRNETLDLPDELDRTAYVCHGGDILTYTIGGMVSGLNGTVVLRLNGGDDLGTSADGAFTFPTVFYSGADYNVTVATQPANQTCTVVNGKGNIPGANVTGVLVFCSEFTYSVGGTASGLTGTLILQNNGDDDLEVTADEGFTFATELADGSPYNVTVLTHPVAQMCSVANGGGDITSADVASVTVDCIEDITSPTVDLTFPMNGDEYIALDTNIAATFSESMVVSTITTDTFTLYDVTASVFVSGVVSYDDGSNSAVFNPDVNLIIGHEYTATITTGATDLAHNSLDADEIWSFTTIPDSIPSVNTTSEDFIDGGALRTGTTSVMIAIAATDDFGVTGYYVAENDTGVAPDDPANDALGWMVVDSTSSFNSTVPYEISGSYPNKTDVYLYVWFKDAAGNVSSSALDSINLLAAIFSYDFEEGFNGWGADGGLWDVGTPTAGPSECYSGTQCVGTVLDGNYGEYTDSRLITPSIVLPDVTGNEELHLRFRHWFSLGEREIEYIQVQTHDETTATWSDWQTEGTVQSVPDGQTGVSATWSLRDLDLTPYAGQRVRIAFYHTASRDRYSASVSTGWYVDYVSLNLIPSTTIPSGSILQNGFEEGFENWGADGGLWDVGTPTAGPSECYSGTQCVGTVLDGNYGEYTDSRLISPSIVFPDVTGNEELHLRFRHWFSLGEREIEYVQVQTYDETTATWSDWQTESTVQSVPDEQTSVSATWSLKNLDLTPYAGQRVRIAFYHTASRDRYSASVSTGWYIDDVSIEIVTF